MFGNLEIAKAVEQPWARFQKVHFLNDKIRVPSNMFSCIYLAESMHEPSLDIALSDPK